MKNIKGILIAIVIFLLLFLLMDNLRQEDGRFKKGFKTFQVKGTK